MNWSVDFNAPSVMLVISPQKRARGIAFSLSPVAVSPHNQGLLSGRVCTLMRYEGEPDAIVIDETGLRETTTSCCSASRRLSWTLLTESLPTPGYFGAFGGQCAS
jgi:hypothetical protein